MRRAASSASPDSPTTSMSGSPSRSSLMPRRTISWSSSRKTRIGVGASVMTPRYRATSPREPVPASSGSRTFVPAADRSGASAWACSQSFEPGGSHVGPRGDDDVTGHRPSRDHRAGGPATRRGGPRDVPPGRQRRRAAARHRQRGRPDQGPGALRPAAPRARPPGRAARSSRLRRAGDDAARDRRRTGRRRRAGRRDDDVDHGQEPPGRRPVRPGPRHAEPQRRGPGARRVRRRPAPRHRLRPDVRRPARLARRGARRSRRPDRALRTPTPSTWPGSPRPRCRA